MATIKEKYGLGKNTFTTESLMKIITNDISNSQSGNKIEYVWLYGKVAMVLPELLRMNINFEVRNTRDITCKLLIIHVL